MVATFLIALREGLEAALVVGIVLSVLQRVGQGRKARAVWSGVALAVVVSLAAALALNALGVALTGPAEGIFEGAAMLLAVAVLTWMIFWMGRQGRQVQAGLESQVERAAAGGSTAGLFTVAFLAVLREGVETALFLTAATFGLSALQSWLGALLGLAAAAGLGALLFAGGRRVDLRIFFRITGVLLLLIAAGLLARGVHELQESGLLPVLLREAYDVNAIVDEEGPLGLFLKALAGYNGNPSLLEVLAYGAYTLGIGVALWRSGRSRPTPVSAGSGSGRPTDCDPQKEEARC